MALAEGVSARVTIKAHSTGVITPGTEPTLSSDPGASGGQVLRRTACSLTLSKDTFQSGEIRNDRQKVDFRHGMKRVAGSISGELSPATYEELLEAAFRGTWNTTAVTADQSDLTSASADNATAKFTFGGGNPVSIGLRVGHVIRFTGLADADNNSRNFVILGIGGSNNRELTVYPAPDTMSADTSFSLTTVGGQLIVPAAGSFVSRKFAVEAWNEDVDIARVFSECRVGGFTMQIPAQGMATVEFPIMGRNMTLYEGSFAPFFAAPTAETTTRILAGANGLLRVGGQNVAVVTGLSVSMDLSGSMDPVVGSLVAPDIFLAEANVTGQMTAFFEDADLINDFVGEEEIEILAYLTGTDDAAAQAITVYLPRVKLGGADLPLQGGGGQVITLPFQALKYTTASTGSEQTTIQIVDTEVTT